MAMVHVSSDYVFDGRGPRGEGKARPYRESDPTDPLSAYGESKLAGEHEVLAVGGEHVVVRSAWLFGVGGSNFVATMLRVAGEQQAQGAPCEVRVVTDQVGSPTWTGHLAPALIGLLERGVRGLVHLAGSGAGLLERPRRRDLPAGRDRVRGRAGDAPPRWPARRRGPAFSALESEREDVLPLPPWQDGLAGYLAARAGMIRA